MERSLYVSPLYLGSKSDTELTRVSGFLEQVQPGVCIMADRGFTINGMLKELGADLNLLPFLQGQKQLSADEVSKGRSIASLRIHVERAIGRMKQFKILKGTMQLKMARIADQVVTVIAFLSNFQPALVPPSPENLCSQELPSSHTHTLTKSLNPIHIQGLQNTLLPSCLLLPP